MNDYFILSRKRTLFIFHRFMLTPDRSGCLSFEEMHSSVSSHSLQNSKRVKNCKTIPKVENKYRMQYSFMFRKSIHESLIVKLLSKNLSIKHTRVCYYVDFTGVSSIIILYIYFVNLYSKT
jgi:hypothetical protein